MKKIRKKTKINLLYLAFVSLLLAKVLVYLPRLYSQRVDKLARGFIRSRSCRFEGCTYK
jgi:hypothetical protein